MARLSKKSRHPKTLAPARDSRRTATQARGSAVAVIGVADRHALGRAYLARRKIHGTAAAQIMPDARKPRDRPACWLRPAADRPDQPADHRRAYDDDGGQVSGDR